MLALALAGVLAVREECKTADQVMKSVALSREQVKFSHQIAFTSFALSFLNIEEKGDWDFQSSDMIKSPDGTDILPLW